MGIFKGLDYERETHDTRGPAPKQADSGESDDEPAQREPPASDESDVR